MTATRATAAPAAAAVYLASVVLANWLTTRYGFVPVGFGLTATAGTFAAGGALVVRDLLQDTVGRAGVLALILAGAVLSFAVAAPAVATASACAFLCAELLDMAVYTPLRRRGQFGGTWWGSAVVAGGLVGALADTVLFLAVAFGWAAVGPALPGQMAGKLEVVAALAIVGAVSGAVFRQSVQPTRS